MACQLLDCSPSSLAGKNFYSLLKGDEKKDLCSAAAVVPEEVECITPKSTVLVSGKVVSKQVETDVSSLRAAPGKPL